MFILTLASTNISHSIAWFGPEIHVSQRGAEQRGQGDTWVTRERGVRHSRQTGTVTVGGATTQGESTMTNSPARILLVATRYLP